ncbi:laglidadg endonuclease [Halorubrum virus VOLN27B]|nr:laglidadg endonuclease [Halorubrum virus VOLN27B]
MINRRFLEWLDVQFGVLTTGVTKIRTAEEQAENSRKTGFTTTVNDENYHDLYMCNTRSLPELQPYSEWYSSGKKVFPESIRLTPLTLKMWYVTDGSLTHRVGKRKPMQIGCSNESDRGDFLESLFEDTPISPRFDGKNLWFGVDDTDTALEWMGSPPPGFEYKWEQNTK